MISMVVFSQSVAKPECFATELTGVGQTINVLLDVFFHVTSLTTAVITSLAVKSPVSLLHQLLYLLINLVHVSDHHRLLAMTASASCGRQRPQLGAGVVGAGQDWN